ncbi:hypothetical protein Patl1_22163 [Pistacia atlantica]|uniref:Uncharacterized protein n=1 Tax=Pistacia atlantica TaxID=434234 RepID=A0ACC1BKT3_9ROSI|nr:hypothetical protein Patl1_22163 [Pistacia atlantica]
MLVTHMDQYVSTPGEAITVAQEVVKTMLAKGYVLSKDALVKAKAMDESYGLSAKAAAKKSPKQLHQLLGNAAVSAAIFTGRTAKAAGTAVVNSSYFATGALWVSGVLECAAKAAADLATHDTK